MNRERSSGKSIGLAILVLMVFLSPVMYVLSIGPVVAISERTGVGRDVVEVAYFPVFWLHDNTPLDEPLERYAELWGWQ